MNELLELLEKSKEDIRNGRVAPIEDTVELYFFKKQNRIPGLCFYMYRSRKRINGITC